MQDTPAKVNRAGFGVEGDHGTEQLGSLLSRCTNNPQDDNEETESHGGNAPPAWLLLATGARYSFIDYKGAEPGEEEGANESSSRGMFCIDHEGLIQPQETKPNVEPATYGDLESSAAIPDAYYNSIMPFLEPNEEDCNGLKNQNVGRPNVLGDRGAHDEPNAFSSIPCTARALSEGSAKRAQDHSTVEMLGDSDDSPFLDNLQTPIVGGSRVLYGGATASDEEVQKNSYVCGAAGNTVVVETDCLAGSGSFSVVATTLSNIPTNKLPAYQTFHITDNPIPLDTPLASPSSYTDLMPSSAHNQRPSTGSCVISNSPSECLLGTFVVAAPLLLAEGSSVPVEASTGSARVLDGACYRAGSAVLPLPSNQQPPEISSAASCTVAPSPLQNELAEVLRLIGYSKVPTCAPRVCGCDVHFRKDVRHLQDSAVSDELGANREPSGSPENVELPGLVERVTQEELAVNRSHDKNESWASQASRGEDWRFFDRISSAPCDLTACVVQ